MVAFHGPKPRELTARPSISRHDLHSLQGKSNRLGEQLRALRGYPVAAIGSLGRCARSLQDVPHIAGSQRSTSGKIIKGFCKALLPFQFSTEIKEDCGVGGGTLFDRTQDGLSTRRLAECEQGTASRQKQLRVRRKIGRRSIGKQ
jgi:hypothetical protein